MRERTSQCLHIGNIVNWPRGFHRGESNQYIYTKAVQGVEEVIQHICHFPPSDMYGSFRGANCVKMLDETVRLV